MNQRQQMIETIVEAVVVVLDREGIEVDLVMRADMVMEAGLALRRAKIAADPDRVAQVAAHHSELLIAQADPADDKDDQQ